MEERFAYGLNPKKLGAVSAYLCDPASAPAEFLLLKSQYQAETGRAVERGALFFQIRQAFPPGEVTPEEANKIGYETAMRWTKGKYQFFVCTHIDKGHIHNHIYYNSTAQDCSRKFHNFIGSSFAVRRLSDRVCIEHELSVIHDPKLPSRGPFRHYGQWLGDAKRPSQKEQLRAIIDEVLAQPPADLPAFLSALEAAGLDPYVGFLHRDRPGRTSLALDLMEELRPCMADRFVITLINNRVMDEKVFIRQESGAVLLNDDGRRKFFKHWQDKKRESLTHAYLGDKLQWGMVPYIQAQLLARYLRGDLDDYPPFLWK